MNNPGQKGIINIQFKVRYDSEMISVGIIVYFIQAMASGENS